MSKNLPLPGIANRPGGAAPAGADPAERFPAVPTSREAKWEPSGLGKASRIQ